MTSRCPTCCRLTASVIGGRCAHCREAREALLAPFVCVDPDDAYGALREPTGLTAILARYRAGARLDRAAALTDLRARLGRWEGEP